MKVIYGIGRITNPLKKSAVAIGVFDGVHKGHQHVIKALVQKAKSLRIPAVVITFFPHPVHILRPHLHVPYLISLDHRLKLLEELGVDYCLVIKFNKRFSHLKPDVFVKKYLVEKLGAREIIVGDDFRFGEDRSGNLKLFEGLGARYGFHLTVISEVHENNINIHSSYLRQRIAEGNLVQAQQILGRRVSVLGSVVKGDGRGKQLGYPTANIQYECGVLPPNGVYLVEVFYNKKRFFGLANIGQRPSFKPHDKKIVLEVHILNFKKNIYGQKLLVELIKKIRDEKEFPRAQDLINQIRSDEKTAIQFFFHSR